jgi:hypothetical protein
MIGMGGAYVATTLNKAGICTSDALTVWGRTLLDGIAGQVWAPNGIHIGNNRGDGKPDMLLDTCAGAPPATGTWRQGDACWNINFNGISGTIYWIDTTAGFSSTPQWTPVPFIGGITAITGDATASGVGSVSLTLASVNSNTGPCGDATHVCQSTYDAKGRVTAAVPVAITATGGTSSPNYQFSTGAATSLTAAQSFYMANGVAAGMSSGNPPANYGVMSVGSSPITSLYVSSSLVIATGNTVAFTLFNNGVATPISCPVAGNSSTTFSCSDTSHSFTPSAGSRWVVQAICTGTCGANSVGALQASIQ